MYYINVFFIFSILGHTIENFVYKHVDSGIFSGYWTPIYGVGVILIILIHNILKKRKINKYLYPFVLFIINALILSTLECLGGITIEKLFGRIFWDYSSQQFNIGKYTSLRMFLIWGSTSILVVYILKPLIDKVTKKIPKFITHILVFLFIFDIIFTIVNLGNFLS